MFVEDEFLDGSRRFALGGLVGRWGFGLFEMMAERNIAKKVFRYSI